MAKFNTVTLELGGGEEREILIPQNATVSDAVSSGAFGSTAGASFLVNGSPADINQELQDGDLVSLMPKSGKQG